MSIELRDFKITAGGNNQNPPDGAPEGMNRTDVNNVIREVMAAIARFYRAPEWVRPFEDYTITRISDTNFRIDGFDARDVLTTERRIKLDDGVTQPEGHVVTAQYSGGNTTVIVNWDGAGVTPAGTSTVYMAITHAKEAAWRSVGTASDEIPDGANLSGAISTNISASSAALKDYAASFKDNNDHVPLYGQIGSVAQYDRGQASGQVPLVNDLPSILGELAYEDIEPFLYADKTGGDEAISSEQDIAELTALTLPGTPDGSAKYVLDATIQLESTSGGTAIIRVYIGSTGDMGDTEILELPAEIGTANYAAVIAGFQFVPGATDTKIGLSCEETLTNIVVKGSSNIFSFLRVRRINE